MKRIVIQLSELSRENWNRIYLFIERCFGNNNKYSKNDFDALKENNILVGIDENPIKRDVCSITDNNIYELQHAALPEKGNYVFNIIYVKTDERKDFPDFTRFFILDKKYPQILTLGINLESIQDQQAAYNAYVFPLCYYLFFIDNEAPKLGINRFYRITKKGSSLEASAFPFKSNEIGPDFKDSNPYIFPLLPINKNNFCLFEKQKTEDPRINQYFENSINKCKQELKNFAFDDTVCRSLFEKWFLYSYLYATINSISKRAYRQSKKKVDTTTILAYCDNIRELVQNIIFHTQDQQGFLYIVFNKKERVSSTLHDKIPNFQKYDDKQRFVQIGVFDYNTKGIVETFSEANKSKIGQSSNGLELEDFFDPKKILPDNANYIAMRCASHLGIKSFVSSIMHHKGYFYIESNKWNKNGIDCQRSKDSLENRRNSICNLSNIQNIEGTHYEIILPPIGESSPRTTASFGIQAESVFDTLKKRLKNPEESLTIKEIKIACTQDHEFQPTENFQTGKESGMKEQKLKDIQEEEIKQLGEQILEAVKQQNASGIQFVAINISKSDIGKSFDAQFFKLLAYIQPSLQDDSCLIFTHIVDERIDRFCQLLNDYINKVEANDQPIWADNHPIVLIGEAGTTRIFGGKTKEEMAYLNHRINLYYITQSAFPENQDGISKPSEDRLKILDKWVKPYDCLIESDDSLLPLFISRVEKILDEKIENDKMGCLINIPTKIGSKIYIENFYEADFLFQNNYFTDRFAYLIAKEIVANIRNEKRSFSDYKKLVLIGYNPYSSPLTEQVKKYVSYCCPDKVSDIIIAKEDDKDKRLVFNVSDTKIKQFNDNANLYAFISIVPIASTLSTTDKIIAFFKKEVGNPNIRFIYNHVTILVRDKLEDQPTQKEIGRKWKANGIEGHTITTFYQSRNLQEDGMKVDYILAKAGLWHNLIDENTFPKKWFDETYINQTKNASINTREMFGLPKPATPNEELLKSEFPEYNGQNREEILDKYYKLTEARLLETIETERTDGKDSYTSPGFIYVGHLEHHGSHHRYYFDIEKLFESYSAATKAPKASTDSKIDLFKSSKLFQFPELEKWLKNVKNTIAERKHDFNVIITPDPDYESCYVNTINNIVFGNNAFVIYLNINDLPQNNWLKLSYLRDNDNLKKAQFYYVDKALHTGDTFQKTRSQMASILNNNNFQFDGIIAGVNRLSDKRQEEILHNLKDKLILSYLHFFVLPSKVSESSCSLCDLYDLYNRLLNYSSIKDCQSEITDNRGKFISASFDPYKKEGITKTVSTQNLSWCRMMLRQRLFFELTKKSIPEKLNAYFNRIYDTECTCLDLKISFLKAITFAPLSQYVKIRQYALKLQLKELKKLLDKKNPDVNDIKLLLVLLKHLAFLGSNAIVRRDVIIRSWKLFYKAKESCIEPIEFSDEAFTKKFIFYIKLATYKDEAKSLWLGELLRKGKEINLKEHSDKNTNEFSKSFKVSETRINNSFFSVFDCKGTKNYFKKRYIPFLYYENTAITHKTLEALGEETTLKKLFYESDRLKPFSEIFGGNNITSIINQSKKIIENEYYYSWFRHYLSDNNQTPDGIALLEKIVLVLYEKLLLEGLTNPKTHNDKPFDQNAYDLLEVAAKVMDADAAFITIKEETDESLYILAKYKIPEDEKKLNNYYSNQIDDCYSTTLLLEQDGSVKGQPFIIRKYLSNTDGEGNLNDKKYNRATYLMLNSKTEHDKRGEYKSAPPVGIVTFLYDDEKNKTALKEIGSIPNKEWFLNNKPKTKSLNDKIAEMRHLNDSFINKAQESGRLLLLLKTQLDEYVKHVANEKQFQIWKEKQESLNRFEKVYSNSNHVFRSVHKEMGRFEKLTNVLSILDEESKKRIANDVLFNFRHVWYWLTNEMISFIYANIERNNKNGVHYLNLDKTDECVIDENATFEGVFSPCFITMLNNMIKMRWVGQKIFVNDININDPDLLSKTNIPRTKIGCNIYIIQTFITQCLNNSLRSYNEGGHRICDQKEARISVSQNCITIKDQGDNNTTDTILDSEIRLFNNRKKPSIERMTCERYSCTTLTSLQGFVNFMNKTRGRHAMDCDYGYDFDYNFTITITFNN